MYMFYSTKKLIFFIDFDFIKWYSIFIVFKRELPQVGCID